MLDYPQKRRSAPHLQEGHLLIVFPLHACKRQNITVQYSTGFKKKKTANKNETKHTFCRLLFY